MDALGGLSCASLPPLSPELSPRHHAAGAGPRAPSFFFLGTRFFM